MRALATLFVFLAVLTAGCLRGTAFRCAENSDCGTGGVCEAVGFCSVANAECPGTGRSYSDSAGQGLSNTCVSGGNPGPGGDAGIDASSDAMPTGKCPSGYAAVAGSAHLYKALSGVSWDEARMMCNQTSSAAYLAIPDDAPELANLATVASAPFWVGIDDKATSGMFVTQKGAPASFLPWGPGQPNLGPQNDCVTALSATQLATEKCSSKHAAVCECEP
jgi:lectin-like protein